MIEQQGYGENLGGDAQQDGLDGRLRGRGDGRHQTVLGWGQGGRRNQKDASNKQTERNDTSHITKSDPEDPNARGPSTTTYEVWGVLDE